MTIDGYVAKQMKKAMLNSEQEQVKIYDAYYNRGVTDGYNKAIDECKNIVIQTLDNEGLADTLLLRMENLKGEK